MSMEHDNKPGNRRNLTITYILIGVILVLLAGLPVYYALHKQSTSKLIVDPAVAKYLNKESTGSNSGTLLFKQGDTVSVPGPYCNTNDPTWWGVGNHYKAVPTPTATTGQTNSSLNATPTPQLIADNSTVATCQAHGLYVQHINHSDSFAEVFFQGDLQKALSPHFTTQITATALNPSSEAAFELGVRHQNWNGNSRDSGYGDDLLIVGVDGYWRTHRVNDVTDQYDAPFTRGYVKPADTMTLGAEVDGPRITFSINDQKITTIVDTTFPHGYAIGFGLSDSGARSSPTALYSNFSYQPLPDTTLASQSAVATATVQANQDLHVAYTAAVPGFGCGHGRGQWQPVRYATSRCQRDGLAISQNPNMPYSGATTFYGLDGTLPANYTVKVQIDTSQLNDDGCAGLSIHTDTHITGYAFDVCANGYWSLEHYSSSGQGRKVADGFVNPQAPYTLMATIRHNIQSFSLDGVTVSTIHDASLSTTDRIALTMYAGKSAAGTVLFSNFAFTPFS